MWCKPLANTSAGVDFRKPYEAEVLKGKQATGVKPDVAVDFGHLFHGNLLNASHSDGAALLVPGATAESVTAATPFAYAYTSGLAHILKG